MPALISAAVSALCYTAYRLLFIDTMSGFLEGSLPLRLLYYAVMGGTSLFFVVRVFLAELPDDPISGGSILSQLIVMLAGVMACALSAVMLIQIIDLLPSAEITLGNKISRVIGLPLSLIGGLSLIYTGYDYTCLSTRKKKACFALLGASMQTYLLLHRFPDMLEVSTAPTQSLELLYYMAAALFMLFWARTLSGSASRRQNRLTYMAGGIAASLGFALLTGEVAVRVFLSDFMPVHAIPLLDMLMIASVSSMALNFTTAFPRRKARRNEPGSAATGN